MKCCSVFIPYQRDIEGYAQWQAGNRQLNRELFEYNRMKEYYGESAPYKTLAGFRRASRAESSVFKQYKQVWTGKGLTINESDVIITSENIKRALGEKTRTLQEAIQKADENVSQAFERYQSQLKIVDAHYKRDKDYWRKHPVGEEAFAHFTSVISVNKGMEEKYRAYFPRSFQVFEEILKL